MRKPKPTAKKNLRPLATITRQIHAEERASVFKIGKLLLEAKDQVKRGQWLPYLKQIGWEARTAQLYMAVASLAAKYETISHLDAAPTALFALTWVAEHNSDAVTVAVERLEKSVARKDPASVQRRTVMLSSLASKNPMLTEIALEGVHEAINQNCYGDPVRSEAMEAQARAIGGANPTTQEELEAVRAQHPIPDPSLPDIPPEDVGEPEPEPLPHQQELVDQFKEAIDALLPLAARSSATFAGIVAPFDLDMVANFLKQVADASRASERQDIARAVAEHLR
jgi:hypothetical protein